MSTIIVNSEKKSDLRLVLRVAKRLKLNACPLTKEEMEKIEGRLLRRKKDNTRDNRLSATDEALRKLWVKARVKDKKQTKEKQR